MKNINFVRTNFFPKKNIKISNKDLLNIIPQDLLVDFKINNEFIINEVSSIEKIYKESILFISNHIDFKNLENIQIITDNINLIKINQYPNVILVKNINLIYNLIINSIYFHEDDANYQEKFIKNNNYFISEYAKIGKNVKIGANSIICRGVQIGDNAIIKNNVIIKNTIVGNNVNIGDNSVIGGTGFGFDLSAFGANNLKPHIGIVYLEDNVRIGSCCNIDRARIHITYIGLNTMLDSHIHIGHNVYIGNNCCFAAQSGIAGSTTINDNVIVGGQVGIAGHINIGNNVKIAAKSGVTKNIHSNSTIAGFPAIDIKEWKKNIIIKKKNGHK